MKTFKLFLTAISTFITLTSAQYAAIPTPGTVWKVGQTAEVKFTSGKANETVGIFFENYRVGGNLASGPLGSDGATFRFSVPAGAVSPPGQASNLLIIHRINYYLTDGETIPIQVEH